MSTRTSLVHEAPLSNPPAASVVEADATQHLQHACMYECLSQKVKGVLARHERPTYPKLGNHLENLEFLEFSSKFRKFQFVKKEKCLKM